MLREYPTIETMEKSIVLAQLWEKAAASHRESRRYGYSGRVKKREDNFEA
jgi:hypothetical protein